MITIDNISCYLPYGLKFISDMDKPYHEYGKQRAHICNGIIELFGDDCLNSKEFNDAYAVGRCLPILYPSLTTPITHKGKTFVPLLELAKIMRPDRKWELDQNGKFAIDKESTLRFCIEGNGDMVAFNLVGSYHVPNQLQMLRKCYEWKINLEGIEAVDPANLDVNPYE